LVCYIIKISLTQEKYPIIACCPKILRKCPYSQTAANKFCKKIAEAGTSIGKPPFWIYCKLLCKNNFVVS
jgi:hypothetical protein